MQDWVTRAPVLSLNTPTPSANSCTSAELTTCTHEVHAATSERGLRCAWPSRPGGLEAMGAAPRRHRRHQRHRPKEVPRTRVLSERILIYSRGSELTTTQHKQEHVRTLPDSSQKDLGAERTVRPGAKRDHVETLT